MKIFSLVLNSVEFDSRVLKTAKTLSAYGDVTIIGLRDDPKQTTKLSADGFEIERRIAYSKPNKPGIRKRIAQASAYLRYVIAVSLQARKGEVVVCNDLATLPVGLLAKIFQPTLKIVYDCHEYQAHTRWIGPYKRRIVQLFESFALRFTAATIVVSPSIAKAYAEDYNIPEPFVVMNCPPLKDSSPTGLLRKKIGASTDDFIILFQGGLTEGRGIEQMLEAFKQVTHSNLRLVYMGFGPLAAKIESSAKQDSRIALISAVAPSEVLAHSADANFGICFLIDDCLNHRYALPNKVFEYLMAGVPVLVNNLVEVRQLVDQFSVGIVIPELTSSEILRSLERLPDFDSKSFSAQLPELQRKFSWDQQAKVWDRIMADLNREDSR